MDKRQPLLYLCCINYKNKLNNQPKKTTKMKNNKLTAAQEKHAIQLIALCIGLLLSFITFAAISNPRLFL